VQVGLASSSLKGMPSLGAIGSSSACIGERGRKRR
jgi:hypothetical protein